MNNLVVDIGNSSIKLAVFKGRKLAYKETQLHLNLALVKQLISDQQISHSLISSVGQEAEQLEQLLKTSTQYLRFSHQTALPINNQYQSPETLGLDRLAALMGARAVYPQQNTLVIDAGTCITYDLIDADDTYWGGSISPGIQLRLKALHTFTAKLPLVEFKPNFIDLIGTNTSEAILSGINNGILGEVTAFIEKYLQKYNPMQILLCGGDANFFDTRLKNSIFAHSISVESDLVLLGLNEIIHHQHD